MPQAFLHGSQDMGVATCLDKHHPVGMEASQMERRRKKVAPAQAPEDGAGQPAQDSCEKNGCRRIVGELATAGDLVERAGGDPPARQAIVDRGNSERKRGMTDARAFDPRDVRTQIGKEGRLTHDAPRDSEMRNSRC